MTVCCVLGTLAQTGPTREPRSSANEDELRARACSSKGVRRTRPRSCACDQGKERSTSLAVNRKRPSGAAKRRRKIATDAQCMQGGTPKPRGRALSGYTWDPWLAAWRSNAGEVRHPNQRRLNIAAHRHPYEPWRQRNKLKHASVLCTEACELKHESVP